MQKVVTTGFIQFSRFVLGRQPPVCVTASFVIIAMGLGIQPDDTLAVIVRSPHQAGFGVGYHTISTDETDCQGNLRVGE